MCQDSGVIENQCLNFIMLLLSYEETKYNHIKVPIAPMGHGFL